MIKIETHPERCTGCMVCQYQCSFLYGEEYNPSKARIIIEKSPYDVMSINFTDECTNCGTCARFCAYGALKIAEDDKN
ncbi:MAG: 4Fe-4S dicluster domain-containing protein [Candidatus Helarchaeota archaeon]